MKVPKMINNDILIQDYAASRIDHYFSSKKALMEQLRLAENTGPMK